MLKLASEDPQILAENAIDIAVTALSDWKFDPRDGTLHYLQGTVAVLGAILSYQETDALQLVTDRLAALGDTSEQDIVEILAKVRGC